MSRGKRGVHTVKQYTVTMKPAVKEYYDELWGGPTNFIKNYTENSIAFQNWFNKKYKQKTMEL